jgi:hypothetical protein
MVPPLSGKTKDRSKRFSDAEPKLSRFTPEEALKGQSDAVAFQTVGLIAVHRFGAASQAAL